jgi:hypothetical protein
MGDELDLLLDEVCRAVKAVQAGEPNALRRLAEARRKVRDYVESL